MKLQKEKETMENKIILTEEDSLNLYNLIKHLEGQIQEIKEGEEQVKKLNEINGKLYNINKTIMDLKTELAIAEGRKQELLEERSNYVAELQTELDKKDKKYPF